MPKGVDGDVLEYVNSIGWLRCNHPKPKFNGRILSVKPFCHSHTPFSVVGLRSARSSSFRRHEIGQWVWWADVMCRAAGPQPTKVAEESHLGPPPTRQGYSCALSPVFLLVMFATFSLGKAVFRFTS